MAASKQKNWLENGPEQRQLNQLFETNKIDEASLPNKIRQASEAFMAFPAKIFAAHFRKTKARYGAYANTVEDQSATSAIPELSGLVESKKRKIGDDDDIDEDTEDTITFKNPPVMTWVHYDSEQKVDIVNVALPVISGSENVDFNLSEDGTKLIVNFTWPTLITVPRVLFVRKAQVMPLSHPRINAMSAELVKREISEKSKPTGSIIVRLPMKVQREVGTWDYEGMRINNTDAILLNFKAFQKRTVIDDANTKVTFD